MVLEVRGKARARSASLKLSLAPWDLALHSHMTHLNGGASFKRVWLLVECAVCSGPRH